MTIWEKTKNRGGKFTVYYAFTRTLGALPALLLSRLFSEYNYAEKNNFIINDLFFTKKELLTYQLGCDLDELDNALDVLNTENLLESFNNHFNCLLIKLNIENIIEFIDEIETNTIDNSWDIGLNDALNPKINLNNFSDSIQIIINTLTEIETKTSSIVIEQIATLIDNYENINQSDFLNETNLKTLEEYFSNYRFDENSFVQLIIKLTKE